jgi:hypothetical protein
MKRPRKRATKKTATPADDAPSILSLKEGVYENVLPHVYHNLPEEAVSRSQLLKLDPPARYRDYIDRRVPREAHEFMDFGTAWHTRILEPKSFFARHVLKKYETYRTDEARIWRDTTIKNGLTILDKGDMSRLDEMEAIMREHSRFHEFFRRPDCRYELTVLSRHSGTGILRRIRIDAAPPGNALHDLKSTVRIEVSAENVGRYIWNEGLGYQAAYYLDTYNAAPGVLHKKTDFVFWFQESVAPFLVGAYTVPHDLIEYCRKVMTGRLYLLAECREKKNWPGYKPLDWAEIPGWAQKQIESSER